jgi:hypothetical protein
VLLKDKTSNNRIPKGYGPLVVILKRTHKAPLAGGKKYPKPKTKHQTDIKLISTWSQLLPDEYQEIAA